MAYRPLCLLIASATGASPQPGYTGGATVAIAVDDVTAAIEELRRKDVAIFSEPHEEPGCYQVALSDPDGNCLILHQRKDGTAG